ncbi:MAG: hypothetical protein BWY54_00203 [Candidatus Dependentiae bacterium ADurb.Bin331]|nr:MAG: hypothetical protein BWY54_00203 [Candidatus Dependentiae bacterium ADurb.Bin331]
MSFLDFFKQKIIRILKLIILGTASYSLTEYVLYRKTTVPDFIYSNTHSLMFYAVSFLVGMIISIMIEYFLIEKSPNSKINQDTP